MKRGGIRVRRSPDVEKTRKEDIRGGAGGNGSKNWGEGGKRPSNPIWKTGPQRR